MIFTYGPLGSICSGYYSPRLDLTIFGLSLYLAVTVAVILITLLSDHRLSWRPWVISLTMIVFVGPKTDAIFTMMPLMIVFYGENSYRLEKGLLGTRFIVFTSCLPVLGLLPLIKLSFAIVVVLGIAFLSFFFLTRKAYRALFVSVCVPFVTLIGAWLAVGQRLTDLPAYFLNALPVISGYTDAMSRSGDSWLLVAFGIGAGSLIGLAFIRRSRFGSPSLPAILMIAATLFLVFKGGFVRQGPNHMIGSGWVLIAFSLVASPWGRIGRIPAAMTVLSICAGVAMVVTSGADRLVDEVRDVPVRVAKALESVVDRFGGSQMLSKDYAKAKAAIAREDPIPLLEGRVDIYSYGQAALLASDNQWTPRPVFQSYAAYTPVLQSINARHLSGVDAPDHIVFAVETIDARLPSLDDGASWPALFVNYAPEEKVGRRIILRRQSDAAPEMVELGHVQARLGQKFDLPEFDGQVYMVANVVPSGFGKLKSLLFKPDTLMATIDRGDAGVVRYRLVSGMMKTPFLISPLIETTSEFLALYAGDDFVADKRVRQMTIDSGRAGSGDWQDVIEVTFHGLRGPRLPQAATMLGIVRPVPATLPDVGECIGAIDTVNGLSAASRQAGSEGLLSVQGWAAVGALPDRPEVRTVLFLEGAGQTFMATTEAVPRPDVVEHFKAPGMLNSGYAARVDLSGLAGDFALRIGIVDGERTTLCPLPPVPLRMKRRG
ncbi:MAG: hypothetical protein QM766_13710 [Burkholderiaceae bacterium]